MSIRNLDKMFRPQSVAVIGASDKPHSVGSALMTNLIRAGFSGPIIPINPHAAAVHGIMAYKDVASLPITPDLAVIATPPDTIPALMSELGGRGTRAAAILTAGVAEGEASIGKERAAQNRVAVEIKAPVALKIRSRDVVHKSDVGGVALNLATPVEVETAARKMIERISRALPNARHEGFIVQEVIHRVGAYELIAGISSDTTFGPVILFGHGDTAVEILRDKSLELPPLNTALARAQIERTRIARLLKGYRDRPAADIDAVVNVLIQLGRIAADHAEVSELDINPLLCDPSGVVAVDCRVRVRANGSAQARLAIRPYPQVLESEIRSVA